MQKVLFALFPIGVIIFISFAFVACQNQHGENAHDAEGNHISAAEASTMEALAYTMYSAKTEIFVEFKPLVVGEESRFAAHLTRLGKNFIALTEGKVTVRLQVNGAEMENVTEMPSQPGIFRMALTPTASGTGKIIFDIVTKDYTDQFVIEPVTVFENEKLAITDQESAAVVVGNDITYLKEQAWKVEFANEPAHRLPFSEVIKTTGQIQTAPGDEITVASQSAGIVKFTSKNLIVGGRIGAGDGLFAVSSSGYNQSNLDAQYAEAKANRDKYKADLDRAEELVKDKIISQREYLDRSLAYQNAQTILNALGKNYSAGNGVRISAPLGGFIKSILVNPGQSVEAGQPLAIISKNGRLVLRADVSQKYFNKLPTFASANFRTEYSDTTYNTADLHGRMLSYGKSADASSNFVPVFFEIDNLSAFVPGSFAEIFLKSAAAPNALVIPKSALIEEQGVFYAFVQTGGESFQKRELKLGPTDGVLVQVFSGIMEGERVVTKGAYQIKLSIASGTLPTHGHEH